jgi:hypothetical protein
MLIIGFEMRDQGGNFQVYGLDGINLHEIWQEEPQAYYGIPISCSSHGRHLRQPISQLANHVWT